MKTKALGEADRLVTLLTREAGKFEAVARGARKTKSKLAAGVDLFTHGRFNFHRGRTWPVVTGQDTIERFNWFREDPDLYPYGLYFAELTDRLVSGEEGCPEIFDLLLCGWRLLGEELDRNLLCRAFELKLADAAGYSPHLDCCTMCSSEEPYAFGPSQGGLLCCSCNSSGSFKILPGTLALARRILISPLEQAKNLRANAVQRKELKRITESFMASHMDLGDLKSRALLNDT